MAYRKIKEPTGTEALIINGWDSGTSPDPYSGMGKMMTANLSIPGEISSGYGLTLNALGTGTLNTPIHRAQHIINGVATAYFILDSASQVWSSTTYSGTFSFLSTSNVTTGATATNQGLVYFIPRSGGAGFLFKFRNDSIDYLAAGAGTWVTGWKPVDGTSGASGIIVPSVSHYAIEGQDSVVYFCNGTGIGKFFEKDGKVFDPTDATTYTFQAWNGTAPEGATNGSNAVPIPSYDNSQSLAEQGNQLLIGGSLNAIYPWDRVSPQVNYPLFIGDTFIDRMVTVNTNVYIFAGGVNSRGRIYLTNGSQANIFFKVPDYITGNLTTTGGFDDPYFTWGDAIFHRNNLIFGFFMKKNGGGFVTADASLGTTAQVWAIDLESNAFRSLSRMDAASGIGRASVLMPALQSSPGFSYIVGVDDSQGATTAAIEYSGTAVGIGRFSVFTDMIPVGTLFDKMTFSQVEIKLRTPLQSGELIQLTPIIDGIVVTSLPATSTVGAISDVYPVNFEQAQWLGFLVVGVGNSETSGVRLFEIRIR